MYESIRVLRLAEFIVSQNRDSIQIHPVAIHPDCCIKWYNHGA